MSRLLAVTLALGVVLSLAYCSSDTAKAMKLCEAHHSTGTCVNEIR